MAIDSDCQQIFIEPPRREVRSISEIFFPLSRSNISFVPPVIDDCVFDIEGLRSEEEVSPQLELAQKSTFRLETYTFLPDGNGVLTGSSAFITSIEQFSDKFYRIKGIGSYHSVVGALGKMELESFYINGVPGYGMIQKLNFEDTNNVSDMVGIDAIVPVEAFAEMTEQDLVNLNQNQAKLVSLSLDDDIDWSENLLYAIGFPKFAQGSDTLERITLPLQNPKFVLESTGIFNKPLEMMAGNYNDLFLGDKTAGMSGGLVYMEGLDGEVFIIGNIYGHYSKERQLFVSLLRPYSLSDKYLEMQMYQSVLSGLDLDDVSEAKNMPEISGYMLKNGFWDLDEARSFLTFQDFLDVQGEIANVYLNFGDLMIDVVKGSRKPLTFVWNTDSKFLTGWEKNLE